ncbi:MAG: YdgA family protein [Variovorax sp.]
MSKALTGVVAAVVVVVAAYGGASWYLGKQVEGRYNAQIDKVIPMLKGPYKLIDRSYKRGVFTSKALLTVELDLPITPPAAPADAPAAAAPPAAPLRVTIENEVMHGPLPGLRLAAAKAETRLLNVDGLDGATRQMFAKASAPQITTVYGFDGAASGRVLLPAGEIDAAPETHTRWQALEGDFKSAADGVHVEGTVRWPEVSVKGRSDDPTRQVDLTMNGFRAEFKSELPASGPSFMATGEGHGTIDKIVAVRPGAQGAQSAPATPLFAIDNLKIVSKTTRDGALSNVLQTATGTGSIGRTPLEALNFELALQRVDTEAFGQLQTLISRELGASSETDRAQVWSLLQRLVAAKPEYKVKFGATFMGRQGEIGVALMLRPDPSATQSMPPGMPLSPIMLQSATGHIDVRLPKAWLPTLARGLEQPALTPETIAAMAAPLVEQGFLKDEGEVYVTQLTYENGQMLLNGKPMPIPPAAFGR